MAVKKPAEVKRKPRRHLLKTTRQENTETLLVSVGHKPRVRSKSTVKKPRVVATKPVVKAAPKVVAKPVAIAQVKKPALIKTAPAPKRVKPKIIVEPVVVPSITKAPEVTPPVTPPQQVVVVTPKAPILTRSSGGKYDAEVAQLLVLLGGASNISSGKNCVSRVRLVLNDLTKVDVKGIEQLPSTKGTIKLPNNQFHIIIGTDVPIYFKAFAAIAGIKEVSAQELKRDAVGRGNFFQRAMQHFSEIFIPIIPVIVAAGLILGFRNILETDFNGFKIIDQSAFMKGVNDFLWIPAQAGLWFLPVYICWSVFKKMGGSPIYGIIIGLTLLIPPLLNVYEVSGQKLAWIWELDSDRFLWNFGELKFPWKVAYTAQVIPAIGVAFFGVYLERLFTEITTPVLRQVAVPLLTILGAYVMGSVIIGPIGWTIGTAISFAVQWALTHPIARWVFAPIFGFLYAPLVITGLHHMLNAVMAQDAGTLGGTIVFPILCLSNIAQGSAALAYTLLTRTSKAKQVGFSATTSAYLGVTEPAMYGINLRYLYPFIASCVGSALGALVIVGTGVSAAGIGNGAWLGVLTIQATSPIQGYTTVVGTGYTWFMVAALITLLTTMTLTWALRRVPRFERFEARVGAL